MATRHIMRRMTGVVPVVAVCALTVVAASAGRSSAQSASSPSYRMPGQTLNLSSGKATSQHFILRGCLGAGPEAAGSSSSTHYRMQVGCPQALSAGLPADNDDGDGVINGTEDQAPNSGDGNGDHIADRVQGNVASTPAAGGPGYVTVTVPDGEGACSQLLNVHAVNPATLGDDPDFLYPFGMVGFKLNCDGPVQVTVIFHAGNAATPPPTDYRKFGHQAPNYGGLPHFYTLPGVVFATQAVGTTGEVALHATFTLTNGKIGDDTDASDHMIVDPSGPARARYSAAPVLTPLPLALLVVLLGIVAGLGLRRPVRH